ncbi:MAG: DUF4430 domain-containing protein [Clostridia bacterium]|nr:DUF4430 domain-containing protein [Clostridia bacterium]
MKKTNMQSWLSLLLCAVLIAAVALLAGCGETKTQTPTDANRSTVVVSQAGLNQVGQGATSFYFDVVDGEGNTTKFQVLTDKTLVGEALMDNGLINGDQGDYGLYVKTVNGITADYDVDQTYWAFYVNGEYATSGVDTTTITPGATYMFKVEK